MNLNKLPCVNTLLLNRYLAEQESEYAYSDEVDRRQAEIEAAGVTGDDVYELGDSLQKRGGTLHDRIALALQAGQSWQVIGDSLIQPELDAIKKNRALNEAIDSMGDE